MTRYIFENEQVFETREGLGALMNEYRVKHSLTQNDLAGIFGCPQPRVSAILNNPRNVSIETWLTYFEALGLEVTIDVDLENDDGKSKAD